MKLIIDVPNEVLKSRHYCQYFGAWSTKLTETIENGIPYEERPQGDSISREALKEKLQARRDNGKEDFDKGYNIGIETAIELIDSAPIVTPQALINGIKDIINKNGITSVDELLEILKKGG